jgi:hypothetical protein
MEFLMALEKTQAAVANLKAAASAMIAHCQDHSAQIAQLQAEVDAANAADASVAADIQATADQINAAVEPAAPASPPAA